MSVQGQHRCPRALVLRHIHFSQDSIANKFQNGRPLEDVLHDLCTGRLDQPLGTLRVVFFDGKWYTRNNRTLYVLKRAFPAERVVPVIVGTVDRLFLHHFSAKWGGVWVVVRRRPGYHHWSRKKCKSAKAGKEAGRPGSQRTSSSPSLARCSAASIPAKIQVTALLRKCRASQANIQADRSMSRCRAILIRIKYQEAWAAEIKHYQLRTGQKHGYLTQPGQRRHGSTLRRWRLPLATTGRPGHATRHVWVGAPPRAPWAQAQAPRGPPRRGDKGDRREGAAAGNASRCFGATTEAADGGLQGPSGCPRTL